ncbi:MAG TPA: cellulase family glycosylhydrolase [Pyrinomonadaceae bacterium]|nr:cellulase family glycosylhydrolase [Pyrinomonadaceae bacterium]
MLFRGPALLLVFLVANLPAVAETAFVSVRGSQFVTDGKPYYFVGTNYWYGTVLGLEKDKKRGIERLRKELDFLRAKGVTNLRLLGGAEGSGMISGVTRVGPPLQPEQGKFDIDVLKGFDLILSEMGKRNMKAVIFISNNWEWSGGFQQYLIWNGLVPKDQETRKLTWDEQRDIVSKFYGCAPCKDGYNKHLDVLLSRTNKITNRKYVDDPTIMAWELANEPRPMRPYANNDYKKWIADVASTIKSKDKNHLVTIGHEGMVGTESLPMFEEIHAIPNIDYLTIHIWAKNWGWFSGDKLEEGFPNVMSKATAYVDQHVAVARKLNKPLVIEEFGLPRDKQSFDPSAPASFRDKYYAKILSYIGNQPGGNQTVAGANFWAFGGTARPILGQIFWKAGDEYMGDPPMEEQGLNTVFDSDETTWKVISRVGKAVASK